jgi:hypothetical protein
MKTDITVYHYDSKNEKYEKKHFYNVSWQGGKGASIDKGYEKANDIKVRIFYKDNPKLDEKDFFIGDFIVVGISKQEIKKQSELKNTYNITSIIPHKRGSLATQHISIGAK